MSSEVRSVGSITFEPLTGLRRGLGLKVWRGQWPGEEFDGHRVWGWCTVVVERNQWVVKTRVEPAIFCCNAMQPVIWHLTEAHDDDFRQINSGPWEVALQQLGDEFWPERVDFADLVKHLTALGAE